MELTALKVRICLKGNNQHDFPAFNNLPSAVRDGVDWSIFVDRFGGWHYDQVCGHADEDETSARGCWNGMLLVPDDFAQAAVAMFPERCSLLTEVEAEAFYNDRAHVRDAAVREDVTTLQAISAKAALGLEKDSDDLNALNPDHPAPGRRRNNKKTFAGFKQAMGITLK